MPDFAETRIVAASVHAVRIPFHGSFRHNLAERRHSDSIIVEVVSDAGVEGYGEGVPRAYVTGENLAGCVTRLRDVLLPLVIGKAFSGRPDLLLNAIAGILPVNMARENGVVWNAARCAVELAVADCVLRAGSHSFADLLPPRVGRVVYSGVLAEASAEKIRSEAKRLLEFGLVHVKLKVSGLADIERVRQIRAVLGKDVSLRLDANGAFDQAAALKFAEELRDIGLDSFEQPVPADDVEGLAALCAAGIIPVMVDESLVTDGDAESLVSARACDLFNIRISKCGGILPCLNLIKTARSAGLRFQLGCQVGESAVLSAAGRHLAAHLKDVSFVEGSFGKHLLTEDLADNDITFGHGGIAPLLAGPGLGVNVCDDVLARHSVEIHEVY